MVALLLSAGELAQALADARLAEHGEDRQDAACDAAMALTVALARLVWRSHRARYGGGQEGLSADGLSSMFIENPLVNLSLDGTSAKARWDALIFHGHDGKARIEGGIFENDYVLEAGIWVVEGLNLAKVKPGRYELCCLPLKVLNSDGAPARAALRPV